MPALIGEIRPVVLCRLRAVRSLPRVLLGPMLARGLAQGASAAARVARPVEGALAADSLIQAPRRTSASVLALMLSLALIVAFSGMARASYGSILALDGHDAQSRSVRHAFTAARSQDDEVSGSDG